MNNDFLRVSQLERCICQSPGPGLSVISTSPLPSLSTQVLEDATRLVQASYDFDRDGLVFSAGDILEMLGEYDQNWVRIRRVNAVEGITEITEGLAPKAFMRNLSDVHASDA